MSAVANQIPSPIIVPMNRCLFAPREVPIVRIQALHQSSTLLRNLVPCLRGTPRLCVIDAGFNRMSSSTT